MDAKEFLYKRYSKYGLGSDEAVFPLKRCAKLMTEFSNLQNKSLKEENKKLREVLEEINNWNESTTCSGVISHIINDTKTLTQ